MTDFFGRNANDFDELVNAKELASRMRMEEARISQFIHPREGKDSDLYLDGSVVLKYADPKKKLFDYKEAMFALKKYYDERESIGRKNPIKDLFAPPKEEEKEKSGFEQEGNVRQQILIIDKQIKQIELDELLKLVIRKEAAKRDVAEQMRKVFESLMNFPARSAATFAAKSDADELYRLMMAEMRNICLELSVWARERYEIDMKPEDYASDVA